MGLWVSITSACVGDDTDCGGSTEAWLPPSTLPLRAGGLVSIGVMGKPLDNGEFTWRCTTDDASTAPGFDVDDARNGSTDHRRSGCAVALFLYTARPATTFVPAPAASGVSPAGCAPLPLLPSPLTLLPSLLPSLLLL